MKNLQNLETEATKATANYEEAKKIHEALTTLVDLVGPSTGWTEGYAGEPGAEALATIVTALFGDHYRPENVRAATVSVIDADREATSEMLRVMGC